MKTKVALMFMLCGMASFGIVPVSEADILTDLMANPPQARYVEDQDSTARPVARQRSQASRPVYNDARPQSRTVLITPGGTQAVAPRVAVQPLRASHVDLQPRQRVQPVTRHASVSEPRRVTDSAAAKKAQIARRHVAALRTERYNQRITPRQPQPLLASTYTQPTQAATHAQRYPQQRTYAPANNYYQGYGYQGWGSTSAAGCAPGRA